MGVADTLYDGSYYNRSVTIDLIQVIRGRVWRIGTGYQTVAQNGYVTFNFTTPATGRVTYSFMDIAKSGGEVTVSLIEAGTYVNTGATVLTPLCMNRAVTDTQPFGNVYLGTLANGNTITGGVAFPEALIPGTSGGNTRPGASASPTKIIYLKAGTMYTVKMLAKDAVTLAATLDLIYQPSAV